MNKNQIEEVRDLYEKNIPLLERIKHDLETETRKALRDYANRIDRISFRVKSIERFMEKVSKKDYSKPLVNIEDQIGGRVIVFFKDDISKVKEKLESNFFSIEDRMVEKPEDITTHKHRDDAFGYSI